jgi:hypothetical protein
VQKDCAFEAHNPQHIGKRVHWTDTRVSGVLSKTSGVRVIRSCRSPSYIHHRQMALLGRSA